jgi:hypothetical protein
MFWVFARLTVNAVLTDSVSGLISVKSVRQCNIFATQSIYNTKDNGTTGNHSFFGKSYLLRNQFLAMFTQPTLYFGTMNGHHKISISGVVFYVEENCRNLLMNHLKWIYRNSSADSTATDYRSAEEKVAEILLDELKAGSEVITCDEVNHLIEKTSTTYKRT